MLRKEVVDLLWLASVVDPLVNFVSPFSMHISHHSLT
jgi:hypothetical protein